MLYSINGELFTLEQLFILVTLTVYWVLYTFGNQKKAYEPIL